IACYTTISRARGIVLKSYRTCLLDGYLSASPVRSSTPPRCLPRVKTRRTQSEHIESALPPKSGRGADMTRGPRCANLRHRAVAEQPTLAVIAEVVVFLPTDFVGRRVTQSYATCQNGSIAQLVR